MQLSYVDTGRSIYLSSDGSRSILNTIDKSKLLLARMKHCVDRLNVSPEQHRLWIEGWAIPPGEPGPVLILANSRANYAWPMNAVGRPDVASALNDETAHNSGFFARIDLSGVPAGEYKVLLGQPATSGGAAQVKLPPGRRICSLAELDEEMQELRDAKNRSFSEWIALRDSFSYVENVSALPIDPFSPEYKAAQLAIYALLSGRDGYNPWLSEPISLDVESGADPHPFPFSTKNPDHIGNHLAAIGHIFKALGSGSSDGKSIIEYGCGNGFTTIMLAAAGYDMTAVEINADGLKILERMAAARGLHVTKHNGVFGDAPDETAKFDHALFYESFHHCIDFEPVLFKLRERLKDDGSVVFAGEPIFPDFSKPWGLRLDGGSLWEIRTHGWLELGFREDFFERLLQRTGWTMRKIVNPGFPNIFVATKT